MSAYTFFDQEKVKLDVKSKSQSILISSHRLFYNIFFAFLGMKDSFYCVFTNF